MVDHDTGVIVACNGEIDNHHELRRWLADRGRKVAQATDIAVIPGLYLELGRLFVSRLVGTFAIAVWDPRTAELLLIRDRAGERPLFFTVDGARIVFATELAAIATHLGRDLQLDRQALAGYLQFGSFTAPATPFGAIRKVAPAEMVAISRSGVNRERYWHWPVVETPKQPPALDRFDGIFREAVRSQSEVDVEFAVFLSGGLDSSLVTAMLRKVRPDRQFKAFTLRFDEESFDEGEFAAVVTQELGIELVPVWVRPEAIPGGLSELVRLVGEPLADPAWLPTALLSRRAGDEARMALVGEGADELFGGYPTYIGAGLAERFSRLPRGLKAVLRRFIESRPPSDKKVTVTYLLKRFVEGAELSGPTRHRLWISNLSPRLLERLGIPTAPVPRESAQAGELLDLIQKGDLETSLAEGLLTKADRASMSSAFELRAPFLDQAVMEFAATLPVTERVRGFSTKYFLKRYALRHLPRKIVYRRKRGLSVPIGRWLRGPLHDWASSMLHAERLQSAGLDLKAVGDLFEEHCRREADHARALWTLIVLSEWLAWAGEKTGVRLSDGRV
jgi:asparagine synthase (glutamine-hydrolysing)